MKSNKELGSIQSLFKAYPILKKINEDNKDIIINHGMFKTVEVGQYMSSMGSECSGILFVLNGVMKIQKINMNGDETNLYDIKSGDFCHEALSCIMKCEPLNIVARAITDTEVFVVDMEVTQNLLLKNPEFLNVMYKDLFSKFNSVLINKENIIHESLDKRLIQLLIDKGTKVIYAKHSEIAFEIDSTRETVSRKLKGLENKGYIKMSRGKIVVLKNLLELL